MFLKKYFGHWELRIAKMGNIFAFSKTWSSEYSTKAEDHVFRFLILSFSMQILNSQWIKCVIFFLLFFFGFSLKSAKIARRKTNTSGSTLVVGEQVGTLSGLDMGQGQGQGQKHVLADADMSGIHWFSQPLKKSVNRAQTQNYKQHVTHADMYECKNEWI